MTIIDRILRSAGAVTVALVCAAANLTNLADDPRYYQKDPHEIVITDIANWHHPTKLIFEQHHLTLTKVDLMWNRTFPVFHVASFGADPGASPTNSFFTTLETDLLRANGGHAFKIVEDNYHDGFVVAYDKRTRTIDREMVQDDDS